MKERVPRGIKETIRDYEWQTGSGITTDSRRRPLKRKKRTQKKTNKRKRKSYCKDIFS